MLRRLLGALLPPQMRSEQLADLDDELRLRTESDAGARRWYRRQLLLSLLPALACRLRAYRGTPPHAPRGARSRGGDTPGPAAATAPRLGPLRDDLVQALRSLARSPAFTGLAILLLGLAMGAVTAAFSVIDAVLLRPLPYPDAARIVYVQGTGLDSENLGRYRGSLTSFDLVAVHGLFDVDVRAGGPARRVTVMPVTEDFFGVFGLSPELGRPLGAEDHAPGAPAVAVVTADLAERGFGSTAGALGRTLEIGGKSFTVVGVMPAGFVFHRFAATEIWIPMSHADVGGRRVVGKLRVGATAAVAEADAARVAERVIADTPGEERGSTHVARLQDAVVGFSRDGLWILGAVVGLVLLVAVANVSALMLVRNERRAGEMAVRVALGASRARLARQVLAEAVLVAAAAAAVGLVAARWAASALLALQPTPLPRSHEVGVDPTVLTFALVIGLACSLLCGLAPALVVPRLLGARSGAGLGDRASVRARRLLVVAEVSIATLLSIGTAVLLRTYVVLTPSDPGFEWRDRLAFRLELPAHDFPEAADRMRLVDDVRRAIGELPGIRSVTATSDLPMTETNLAVRIPVPGSDPARPELRAVHLRAVTADYLSSLSMPIVRGRGIEVSDRVDGEPVAVVNERMAREFWPAGGAVGGRLTLPTPERGEVELTVVGVVADAWMSPGRADARPEVFVPLTQERVGSLAFLVAGSDATSLAGPVAEAVHRVAPHVPMLGPNRRQDRPRPLADVLDDALAPWRYQASLVGCFATLALLLTGAGLYGVLSTIVSRQRHAIAVRMALGGSPASVGTGVLRQGMGLVGIGVAAGALGALAGTRTLEAFVYGVSPADPVSFLGAVTLVAAVGAVACATPVRRAVRTQPLGVLRAE